MEQSPSRRSIQTEVGCPGDEGGRRSGSFKNRWESFPAVKESNNRKFWRLGFEFGARIGIGDAEFFVMQTRVTAEGESASVFALDLHEELLVGSF